MHINRSHNKKRFILTVILLALLVGGGLLAYYWYSHRNSSRTDQSTVQKNTGYISSEPATGDQALTGAQIKKDSLAQADSSADESSGTLTGEVTSTNQVDGTLYIRTIIHKVTSNGSCALKMTGPSTKEYAASAGVQALASSTTCKGFNVPISSLSSGTWNITVTYSDGNDKVEMKQRVIIQ